MTDEPAHDREAALMGRCEMLRAGGFAGPAANCLTLHAPKPSPQLWPGALSDGCTIVATASLRPRGGALFVKRWFG
jgi:hypothetical protein